MRRPLAVITLLLMTAAAFGVTTDNDDSCDIGVAPAATLLLPNFEVDFDHPVETARTTLFTIINTSHTPQIARVTLWTDWAYPIFTFNLFLTGYDVQAINLLDILGVRGVIAPPNGATSLTTVGERSLPNSANPNFGEGAVSSCAQQRELPAPLLNDVRNALVTGKVSWCPSPVGGTHGSGNIAMGYATVDVVNRCDPIMPTDERYYSELLFDNVLIGDWQIIDPDSTTGNYAGGSPLVHIRAIPEGGAAGVVVPTNLPYTFYDRYTPRQSPDTRAMDRRQPLPALFAARYIQGGEGSFNTNFRIWREGVTSREAACSDYAANKGSSMHVVDIVRFDEHENPMTLAGGIVITLPTIVNPLPTTSSTPTSSGKFPPISTAAGDSGGWFYLNLDNNGSRSYSTKPDRYFGWPGRGSQNWVVISMSSEGRYQVAFDAAILAAGCTPAQVVTNGTSNPIAPGPNVTP